MKISKTQIDRLGDRLRKGNITDDDLRLLDEYRRSFGAVYGVIAGAIRRQLYLEPTGRPAKSTTSIAEKLRRESIRLSQIQDIAGCRIVVSDMTEQNRVVASLVDLFPDNSVVDRRQVPSHGYRAVHVIANVDKSTVEIQVRTTLQQLWAELSEKLSDIVDPTIKYGGGDETIRYILARVSKLVAGQETTELAVLRAQQKLSSQASAIDLTQGKTQGTINPEKLASAQEALLASRREIVELLRSLIENPPQPVRKV